MEEKKNINNNNINKKKNFYNLIIFATIISIFSLVPILYQIILQKITSNIPYISLILIFIALFIFMYISLIKQYYMHLFFYTFGLLCISIIIYLKRKYDDNNITLHKMINNIYRHNMQEEENEIIKR
jgi:uncharacterized membrane protein YoaK (UPF0700 family)